MKCTLYGTITLGAETKSVSVSALSLNSADEYIILLDSASRSANASGNTTGMNNDYISAKTKTSFSVTSNISHSHTISYQVITLVSQN